MLLATSALEETAVSIFCGYPEDGDSKFSQNFVYQHCVIFVKIEVYFYGTNMTPHQTSPAVDVW
jgi:hypothetical protein